ncbi:MAG: hypothetical protein M3072_02830 [Candidatus Dormibacteraeota bacterium]|nr:hypothetical protein [Candidatus Dormibacteraeota bacterium]
MTEHVAHAFGTLDRDNVPGERDQVAPVAVVEEQADYRVDISGGQGILEVSEPFRHDGSGS